MRPSAAVIVAGGLLLPAVIAAPSADATAPQPSTVSAGTYLVLLRAQPLATYDGHIDGLAATAPPAGKRFRADSPAVQAYSQFLASRQARLIALLDGPEVLYSYTTAVDGFAAVLTSDQVKLAQSAPGVLTVERSSTQRLAEVGASPSSYDAGRVAQSGNPHPAPQLGRGVVVGVIDSGIWPENPSFAAVPADRRTLRRTYPGFSGTCAHGERWGRGLCNAKVIAAQYFVTGFGRDNLAVADFASPRDGSGHGSHNAASAAGNAGVDVKIGGQDFGRISGAAPGAALSIYKACWTAPDPSDDGCTTADTVEAIDRAVSDGVDVISYSIAPPDASTPATSVDQAFHNAADAGVFVAASAGDDGPAMLTVAYPSPWVTTVAATTHQPFQGVVVLGDGSRYVGSMVSDRVINQARLVDSADVPTSGASARQAALCYPAALDAADVDGAIVVCQRGGIPRVSKSSSVKRAGGIAMVLSNTAPGTTDDDVHSVPTVQLTRRDGQAVRAYIATHLAPTATLEPVDHVDTSPRVALFSSRGPALSDGANVLKPDLAAPGVGIVSAVAPPSNAGRLWDVASGTSMAAPQVAGLAADIVAAHPGWSPAAVKSALMTTATPLGARSSPLAAGAGEIDPRRAVDPGLVYEGTQSRWRRNLASVSIGHLVATRTLTRRVTNVSAHPETYTASVEGLPGVEVSVVPSALTVASGQSRRFSITFTARRAARYEQFVGGTMTWVGSRGHRVASPLAVRASYVEAPTEVGSSGRDGVATIRARAGVTGTLSTTLVGLVAARPTPLTLSSATFDPDNPAQSQSAWSRTYDVPSHTAALRLAVSSVEGDVDLYVYRDGRLVSSAVTSSSIEQLTLDDPIPGRYQVYVAAMSPVRPTFAEFTGWVLPRAARNTHVTYVRRRDVTGGEPFSVDLSWSDLSTSRRWFGELVYQPAGSVTYLTVG